MAIKVIDRYTLLHTRNIGFLHKTDVQFRRSYRREAISKTIPSDRGRFLLRNFTISLENAQPILFFY